MSPLLHRTLQILVALTLILPRATLSEHPEWIAEAEHGLVAADSPYASQAGLTILKAGGNAIDAAVAVSFALGVTRPYSTGLGGGGFTVARFADGRIIVEDFRECAPAKSSASMFVDARNANPTAPPPSRFGHLAVGVPGLLAGQVKMLNAYGTMRLDQVIQPALTLARDGFPVDKNYVNTTRNVLDTFDTYPALKKTCGYVYRTHLNEGKLRRVGDILRQPRLAKLLEALADHGPDFFYKGPVAHAIERDMKTHGGLISRDDLSAYRVRNRKPIVATYRDYKLILMPPPSSGGVAIAEILNLLEPFDFPTLTKRDPGLATHVLLEAMKHAFADRARWLADSDFATVPVDRLTSKRYAAELSSRINPFKAGEPDAAGTKSPPDDHGTSHLCVADKWGNVVASSETINTSFGSLVAIDEWGLILNNQMDDFTAEPGKPNAYGLIQSERNAVAPGKRPLSSMSPTIVLKNEKPFMLIGASGGPRIITSVLNVMLNVIDGQRTLEDAMTLIRPHHQWQPNRVFFSSTPNGDLVQSLSKRGHEISPQRRSGVVQTILRNDSGWIGACDPAKGGKPAGY